MAIMDSKVLKLENDVEVIKTTIKFLKQKDKEILDVLLKTKLLLDRQKIEDMKLEVLEDEQAEEEQTEILAEELEEKSEQIVHVQSSIRTEFMGILNRQ